MILQNRKRSYKHTHCIGLWWAHWFVYSKAQAVFMIIIIIWSFARPKWLYTGATATADGDKYARSKPIDKCTRRVAVDSFFVVFFVFASKVKYIHFIYIWSISFGERLCSHRRDMRIGLWVFTGNTRALRWDCSGLIYAREIHLILFTLNTRGRRLIDSYLKSIKICAKC